MPLGLPRVSDASRASATAVLKLCAFVWQADRAEAPTKLSNLLILRATDPVMPPLAPVGLLGHFGPVTLSGREI